MPEEKTLLLIPVALPEAPYVKPALANLFSALKVILLGYYHIPDQSSPEQVQREKEEEGQKILLNLAEQFQENGAEVETKLVFTHNVSGTIDRVSQETECDAILKGPMNEKPNSMVVILSEEARLKKICYFISSLITDITQSLTLFYPLEEEGERESTEMVMERAKERILDKAISRSLSEFQINERLEVCDDAFDKILEVIENYDIVIIGQTPLSLKKRIFGELSQKVAEHWQGPCIVIPNREESDKGDESKEDGKEE